MAHSLNAKKRNRQNKKLRTTNRARKQTLKTATKKVLGAVEQKSGAEAQTLMRELQAKLDKTAHKGTIHKNKAARRKSRMQKRVNALLKAGSAPQA
ncbi:MAG: 30S ribosomal protein S20 [Planctomycetota bacterium]|nr:30S ribosomal protein S20 [Planctomycetota bacterium]